MEWCLFFQSWFWDGRILCHGFIITIDISWTVDENTKHPQLIPQTFNHIHCFLQCTKLSAGRTCLTVVCDLLYQCIGDLLMKMRTPVWLFQSFRFPQWFSSTKHVTMTPCPLASGMFGGIAYFASRYKSNQSWFLNHLSLTVGYLQ